MIVKNPLIVSGLIVYSFWYILLYMLLLFTRHVLPIWVVEDYPASLLIMGLGAGAGLMATLGVRAFTLHRREAIVHAGDADRGAIVSLGEMPALPQAVRGKVTPEIEAALHRRFWWPMVALDFPAHARAIEAVLGVMAKESRLPASPIPGGHGGRTLIEHSLGVADGILRMAQAWRYTGQKDKRGRVRVRLKDPDAEYHRFMKQDVGLLALAGFAHDIGKVTCYEPSGTAAGRTVPVTEVVPNHDTEGASLLRMIPEVMSLPYPDRRALLVAVGYYHHPGAITISDPVDDRMRSLTELLIAADVATGKAEGHVLDPADYAYGDEDAPEEITAEVAAVASTSTWVPPNDEARPATVGDHAEVSPAANAQDDSLPFELSVLFNLLDDDSAIGSKVADPRKRIGYKYDGCLWLADAMVRRNANNDPRVDAVYSARETDTKNGNASPFTEKLLTQLAERGLLRTAWAGGELAPQRACFVVRSEAFKQGTQSGVFIIPASVRTSKARLPEDKPMEIVRPLWGEKSAHQVAKPKEEAGAPTESTGVVEPTSEAQTEPAADTGEQPAVALSDGYDATDLPPGMGFDEPEPVAARSEVEDDPIALLATSLIEQFPDVKQITTPEGVRRAVLPYNSPEAEAVRTAIALAAQQGHDISAVQTARDSAGQPKWLTIPIPAQVAK